MPKVPKSDKKSSKNFLICRSIPSNSGSESGKNGEKIVKNVKKSRPKIFLICRPNPSKKKFLKRPKM